MWGTLTARERKARRAVLAIISTGKAPNPEALGGALGVSPVAARRLLKGLVAKGFAVRDAANGAIAAAYPLSVLPTRHLVTLGTGRRVHALCAVDALGVSPLFEVSVAIESRCPHCDRMIRVDVYNGEVVRKDPPTAVLWYSMADLLERRIEGLNLSREH